MSIDLVVVGAHLRGEPLNGQLTERAAVFVDDVRTAPEYRLFALPTQPPKPGLLRVTSGGAAIVGERWRLDPAAFGDFVASVSPPLTIGSLALDNGSTCHGFLCESYAVGGALDITAFGGWLTYLVSLRA